jgi:hypothetical protein
MIEMINESEITEGDVWVSKCEWCKRKGIKTEDEWIEYCKKFIQGEDEDGEKPQWLLDFIKRKEKGGCEFVASCNVEDCYTRQCYIGGCQYAGK